MNANQIKQHLMQIFNRVGEYTHHAKGLDEAYFAGGVFSSLVRDEPVADYDIWFKQHNAWQSVDDAIGDRAKARSRFSTTIELPGGQVIQLIQTRIGEPQDTVATFDYAHCAAFFVPATGQLVYDEALILSKELRYVPQRLHQHPVNTFERALKFSRRGYHMKRESIVDLLVEAKSLDEEKIRSGSAGGSR